MFIVYYPFKGSYRHLLYNTSLIYDLWKWLLPLKCVKCFLGIKITFSELRSLHDRLLYNAVLDGWMVRGDRFKITIVSSRNTDTQPDLIVSL